MKIKKNISYFNPTKQHVGLKNVYPANHKKLTPKADNLNGQLWKQYDASGNRIKKLTWKPIANYDSISYIDGVFEYRTDGTDKQNLLHIMDDTSRIAMVRLGDNFSDSTPVIQYNLEDHLGSSVVLLETNAANISKEEYYPFGETSFGSYAKKRYRYCGKEKDYESGLYYYGARYYSPMSCRFISCDQLSAKYPNMSVYAYAFNNPIIFNDPTGMEGKPVSDSVDTMPLNIDVSNVAITPQDGGGG